ncbi:alkaline-shock protein, partial [Escherichia coli]|nr:alkaline-shock protein [Escherichia coli]
YYGSPFREWLKALTADLNGLTAQAKSLMKEYAAALTPKDAGNQVGRAVNRFALVAMAGELATRLGITGWPEGEALRATRVCLNAWLKDRGHTANQEDIAALEQVRSFFTANQYSRFADWYDERNRSGNMVGWRRVEKGSTAQGTEAVTTFYVMPSGWKEICRGFDPR